MRKERKPDAFFKSFDGDWTSTKVDNDDGYFLDTTFPTETGT
jgi:hypothetical protein